MQCICDREAGNSFAEPEAESRYHKNKHIVQSLSEGIRDTTGFWLTTSDPRGPYQLKLPCDSTHTVASWGMIQHGSITKGFVPNCLNKASFVGSIPSWIQWQCTRWRRNRFWWKHCSFWWDELTHSASSFWERSFHRRLTAPPLTGRAQLPGPEDSILLWHCRSYHLCCLFLSSPPVKSGLWSLHNLQKQELLSAAPTQTG